MSFSSWIRFVLLAGLMLSLPLSNASAVSISLRPDAPTTIDIGETVNVDVYIVLDEADQIAGIGSVTMHIEKGSAFVDVTASVRATSAFAPSEVVANARQAISDYFDSPVLVRPGEDVRLSQLYDRIMSAQGVEYAIISKIQATLKITETFSEVGDGDCDGPALPTGLAEIRVTGWCTAEVGGGGRERLVEIAGRMDKALGL